MVTRSKIHPGRRRAQNNGGRHYTYAKIVRRGEVKGKQFSLIYYIVSFTVDLHRVGTDLFRYRIPCATSSVVDAETYQMYMHV